jgi:tetratricopeptide (TPR) repeat protein
MRAYVFADKALVKHAGQFAWLSIDTENGKNAAFLQKFPTQGVPTFLIIDAKSEKAVQNWYGTITVAQLEMWLDDGLRAVGKTATAPAEVALAHADQLNAAHQTAEAVAAYREALAAGGPQWPRYARAVESLVVAFETSGKRDECAKAAMEFGPRLPRGQSFVNVIRAGFASASRGEDIKVLQPLAEEALKVPEGFADDKADIYSSLISAARRQKDAAAVKKYASDMWAFLEGQAKTAPNAEARASLDSWRMTAASALGDPELAIPALEASERDLPNDYNPPSRLASIYQQLGRLDDALAANQRALAKAYGPRRVALFTSRVSLYEKKGDKAAAKQTLEEALKFAETLPNPQGAATVERLRKQLESYR